MIKRRGNRGGFGRAIMRTVWQSITARKETILQPALQRCHGGSSGWDWPASDPSGEWPEMSGVRRPVRATNVESDSLFTAMPPCEGRPESDAETSPPGGRPKSDLAGMPSVRPTLSDESESSEILLPGLLSPRRERETSSKAGGPSLPELPQSQSRETTGGCHPKQPLGGRDAKAPGIGCQAEGVGVCGPAPSVCGADGTDVRVLRGDVCGIHEIRGTEEVLQQAVRVVESVPYLETPAGGTSGLAPTRLQMVQHAVRTFQAFGQTLFDVMRIAIQGIRAITSGWYHHHQATGCRADSDSRSESEGGR